MNKYLVYLAGPITGLSYKEATAWREYVRNYFDERIETVSPLRKKSYLKDLDNIEKSYDNQWLLSSSKSIYRRDKFDCLRADLIFVNFLGATKISIGTSMEIAWAAEKGTPIVLVMDKYNIHNHPMIKEAADFIVEELDDGISLVHDILLPDDNLRS